MHAINQAPLLAGAALTLILLEIFWRTSVSAKGYDFAGAAASLGVFVGNVIIGAITKIAVIVPVYLWFWSLAPIKLPIDDWRVWALGFVAVEFVYYWEHRFSHTIRWLWATHAVHHSSEKLSLPSAVRLGWTGALSGGWLLFAPLVLVGFHPIMIAALFAFNLRYQFLLHTELVGKLGPLEWIFNTPSHHRVHHASNREYLDKNFGGVLIIFDRMFGTFANEQQGAPIRYGLVEPLKSHNPFVIAFNEWASMAREVRRSRSLAEVCTALFGAPGAWAEKRRRRSAAHAPLLISGPSKE